MPTARHFTSCTAAKKSLKGAFAVHLTMKTVDITYRYETRDTPARPRPLESGAALGRLNDGNRGFASLLEDPTNKHVQRIISLDSRDLGLGDVFWIAFLL